jgi:prepilin-type N-terminal cleavage/methylation domain-containing protein
MSRRGFSLTELMIAMVLAGFIGVALTRLVIDQSRFVALQDGIRRARSSARSALAVMQYELRQVTDGGLVAAAPESITVRVPYAFGLSCGQQSGTTTTVLALIPPDSALFANASTSGYAYRDSVGRFTFVEPASRVTIGNALCYSASPAVRVLYSPSGLAWSVGVTPSTGSDPSVGTLVYLYTLVRYSFAPSAELPGRTALWREDVGAGTREELVAPFDTSAAFAFLVGAAHTLQGTPPAVLDSVRGVRVLLVAESEQTPQGWSSPFTFDLTTDVYFRNNDP